MTDGQRDPEIRKRAVSEFPKHTLEDALRIAEAIECANAGNPYPPTDTAVALSISPGSSEWRSLTAASFKYGLTTGNYKSDRLALTPLAVRIVAPTSPDDRLAALWEAALNPTTFRSIADFFRGKKLPDVQFFQNTVVREFGVPKEHSAVCVELFSENATFVQLTRETPTGKWLGAEPIGAQGFRVANDDAVESDDEAEPVADPEPVGLRAAPPLTPALESARQRGSAIFIGHGKNKKPREQLEKILNEYGIPFKVAVDEANSGRPISEKVAQTMEECGAAILIFSADEELRSVEGDVIWRPSENVVYELGAASVMYGRRIIIFKESGVAFPSNFRDIGYIEFDKDSLSAKGIDLFRELTAFKIIQVSVAS